MSSVPDPTDLRRQLFADPDNQELRRRYLDSRTPVLLAQDQRRAFLVVLMTSAFAGLLGFALLGLLVGGITQTSPISGTVVTSVGSVGMESSPEHLKIHSHGLATVSRGGSAVAAVSSALTLMPGGAILGALVGLIFAFRLSESLAGNGPRPWWGSSFRFGGSRRPAKTRRAAPSPTAELFLVNPESRAFLEEQSRHLPERTTWREPLQCLCSAIVAALIAWVVRQETPPIPERYLEEPWTPSPLVSGAFGLGALYALFQVVVELVKWRRCRRLETEGEILSGQVIESSSTPCGTKDHETGACTRFWQVRLHYEFLSPTGVRLGNDIDFSRGAIAESQSPEPGTPVAILYVEDSLYQIL